LRHVKKPGARGIEVEVLDQGPGIADCEAAMTDHYSSGGTLGLGLPSVKRMMDEFSLVSAPGEGTRVTVRKWI
jgi:serine/threonine-protein kinase RsbT